MDTVPEILKLTLDDAYNIQRAFTSLLFSSFYYGGFNQIHEKGNEESWDIFFSQDGQTLHLFKPTEGWSRKELVGGFPTPDLGFPVGTTLRDFLETNFLDVDVYFECPYRVDNTEEAIESFVNYFDLLLGRQNRYTVHIRFPVEFMEDDDEYDFSTPDINVSGELDRLLAMLFENYELELNSEDYMLEPIENLTNTYRVVLRNIRQ